MRENRPDLKSLGYAGASSSRKFVPGKADVGSDKDLRLKSAASAGPGRLVIHHLSFQLHSVHSWTQPIFKSLSLIVRFIRQLNSQDA